MKPTGPRELPIIFTAESVRAILAGAKTQTRRVMNPQPHPKTTLIELNVVEQAWIPWDWAFGTGRRMTGDPIRPRYRVGDRIWAKETFRAHDLFAHSHPERPQPTQEHHFMAEVEYRDGSKRTVEVHSDKWGCWLESDLERWRSPLYMPRWASRLTLEVTEVRAQRVQEISEDDAIAEGFVGSPAETPREQFAAAWDGINWRKANWASNPFVFAYTFRRIER